MASYGWAYLTVTHVLGTAHYRANDGSSFSSEDEMFRELGVTGWELVAIREPAEGLVYYFKRSRA